MATKKITYLFCFLVIAYPIAGCVTADLQGKVHRLESYRFDKNSRLVSRLAAAPEVVLDHIRKLDNRYDYKAYLPSTREVAEVERAFALLPVRNRRVLNDRLLGIYFINDFTGNGLCEWAMDGSGTVYMFFIFNPSSFTKTISALLTEKEKTCFINDDTSIDIFVDCGKKYSGFYYILLHESTHAVDYVMNFTPYTDEEYGKRMKHRITETKFIKNNWSGYDTSAKRFSFTGKVSFYDISARKLRISEAAGVYKDLSRSPFVSLYASMSWAEDLAELVTFYHLTRALKQPYRISVTRNRKIISSIFPMESPQVIERLGSIKVFR